MASVKDYLSLIKFSHTIFAMPFAMIGYFLAINTTNYTFNWRTLIPVILCMIFARNAAMAFNRWADARIDKANPRTANREIPKGIINGKQAIAFIIINCALFIATTYFINPLCFYLSPIALTIVLGYSYTKHFTSLSHIILGLGLSIAPIGAYIAVTGNAQQTLPFWFGLVVLTWVGGFDIIYALQDDAFDKNRSLHSIPARLGRKNALLVSIILHLITAAAIIYIGIKGRFDYLYWAGAGFFIAMLAYQHFLVKPRDLSKVNLAFFTANGIASVIYALLVILSFYF